MAIRTLRQIVPERKVKDLDGILNILLKRRYGFFEEDIFYAAYLGVRERKATQRFYNNSVESATLFCYSYHDLSDKNLNKNFMETYEQIILAYCKLRSFSIHCMADDENAKAIREKSRPIKERLIELCGSVSETLEYAKAMKSLERSLDHFESIKKIAKQDNRPLERVYHKILQKNILEENSWGVDGKKKLGLEMAHHYCHMIIFANMFRKDYKCVANWNEYGL